MISGIHHIGLTVTNANSAARFYATAANLVLANATEQQLGLPSAAHNETPETALMLRGANAYVRLLASRLPIIARQQPRPVAEAGIVHICLQSPDMNALYDNFRIAGATFHAPPVDLGTGFLYAYARDLEANVVELEGVPPVWDDPAPWLAHVSFSSADVDRLADFYATVFAQTASKSTRLGPNHRLDAVSGMKDTEFKAAWIPAGNMQVEVIQYFQPATVPHHSPRALTDAGYSYVCLEVADLACAAAHMLASGATQSPSLAAISGRNRYFCVDPDGNILLLLALEPAEQACAIAALPDPMIVSRMAFIRDQMNQKAKTI